VFCIDTRIGGKGNQRKDLEQFNFEACVNHNMISFLALRAPFLKHVIIYYFFLFQLMFSISSSSFSFRRIITTLRPPNGFQV